MQEKEPKKNTEEKDLSKEAGQSAALYFRAMWRSLKILVRETLLIKDNAHPLETIESIKKDIEFKGYNVWILVFSILIASIGLNVNSAAVVIGAMLISPLMGPILGIGLSIGINDWQTLKHSLRHFGIMLTVSILTSTIYFFITPLGDAQSEILARTQPTLLDVFIAFFGGLAGILAANRKIKTNVIPGVAIATALMPPLCTAGYGLANGEWNFFFGAFYLFLINSIFISLSTLLVVRYLKFPVKDFVDSIKEKKAKQYIYIFTLLIVIPSGFIFVGVVQESIFNQRVEKFISENVKHKGTELVKKEIIYAEEGRQINLVMFGEPIPLSMIDSWKDKLTQYDIKDCQLNIIQPKDAQGMASEEVGKLVDVFSESRKEIQSKDEQIFQLKKQLEASQGRPLPFKQIAKELKIQFENIESFGFSKIVYTDFESLDTIPCVNINWQADTDTALISMNQAKIKRFLKVRMEIDKLEVTNNRLQRTLIEESVTTEDSL